MSIYVVDTCVIRELHRHVHREVVPEIWANFEMMIEKGEIVFVRESLNELEHQFTKDEAVMLWIKDRREFFLAPSNAEAEFVREIYKNRHFQQNISEKNIRDGMPVADAFIIAKAKMVPHGVVVTSEKNKPNSAKIPNICQFYSIPFIDDVLFQKILRYGE